MRSKPQIFTIEQDGNALCVKEIPLPSIQKIFATHRISMEEMDSRPLVVLVHQYTILGGSQELMRGLAIELSEFGFSCITFDMRGAGASTGKATISGVPEVSDVAAVCKWAVEKYKKKILLVGSSAGACIAGSAAAQFGGVVGYVGIGYTFGFWPSILFSAHYNAILNWPKPKFFIMGNSDGFTSPRMLEEKMKRCAGQKKWELVAGVGHFGLEASQYDGYLANKIVQFYNDVVKNARE